MPAPIEMYVRQILAERGRASKLRQAVEDAWKIVNEKYPDRAWWRRKSTRAALVWEYSVDAIIEAFKDDGQVSVVRHFDTVSFVFEDAVLLRIKKADLELRSSNYPTMQAQLFHTHEADLFGYAGLQRVEAAYVLNRFETGLDWIGIVAREAESQLWKFELSELTESAEILPFDVPVQRAVEDVVRLKDQASRESEDKTREG